jgi:hypothetical protein
VLLFEGGLACTTRCLTQRYRHRLLRIRGGRGAEDSRGDTTHRGIVVKDRWGQRKKVIRPARAANTAR